MEHRIFKNPIVLAKVFYRVNPCSFNPIFSYLALKFDLIASVCLARHFSLPGELSIYDLALKRTLVRACPGVGDFDFLLDFVLVPSCLQRITV